MDSFLKQTAKAIMSRLSWQQLRHVTLVLPSHRAGMVLRDELLQLQKEQHPQAVWAPDVKTLPQLQDALSPLYAEDELMTIVRLYRLYRKYSEVSSQNSELMPLDLFYGYGRQMIADFTNIDASMHASEVPNFFDNTIAAHELSTWDLDPEVVERLKSLFKGERMSGLVDERDSIKAQYEVLWRNIHTYYMALREQMQAERKGYTGMRQRAVIEQWEDEYVQLQIKGRMYVFVGFNYLLPVERELMVLLRDAGQALFYWDYVPDFETNEKAFSFAKLNSGILGDDGLEVRGERLEDERKAVKVVSCVSKEAQAQFVHRWLQDNYTAKGQKVGVVICDESMLESVIYTLPAIRLEGNEEPEPVNITKGFPLRNTDVYARLLRWLYDRKRGDVEQIVSPDFIGEMLAALFPAVSEESEKSEESEESETISWRELLILESEYQVRTVANRMRVLIAEGLGDVPFTLKLLRVLIRRVVESMTMPFHGEPMTDIQVMGVLETRLMDFDKLLLLNVEEGVVPQTRADASFIPYYLRKSYSMQTSDERATVYAYNFFRLLSRAGHSTLLFTSTDGAGQSKGMSRFIMQMIVSPEFDVTKAQLKESGVLEPVDEKRLGTVGVKMMDQLTVQNGRVMRQDGIPFTLSPSALNTYITCPRLFCFNYIQGVRDGDEDEKIFGSSTIGTLVHDSMLYLYRTYLHCDNSRPVPVQPDEIEQILHHEDWLEQALKYAYDEANKKWAKRHAGETNHFCQQDHRPEQSTIMTYLRNILQRDRADAAQYGLKIYLLEEDRYFDVEVPNIGKVNTGGRIDRVDFIGRDGNETIRVIDYKSGTYYANKLSMQETVDKLMDKPDKGYIRQTLVYCHALMVNDKHTEPIEPNVFYCSKPLEGAKTQLSINRKPVTDYRELETEFIKGLQTKMEQMLTVDYFPACEEGKCPSYCAFFDTCGRRPKEN